MRRSLESEIGGHASHGAAFELVPEVALRQREPDVSSEATGLRENGFYGRAGKRGFDLLFSLAFIVLWGSWLFPLIALAIKLDSRGPIFFRQQRVGQNREVFECLKFRTMRYEPYAAFAQAQKDDPRITRIGRLLRRTNLDEIPQFFNVVRGQMSVVGPRPHVPDLDHLFEDLVPSYAQRTIVRPGVTGLAQVSGCRGETRSVREMTHRVRFDLFYTRNISFMLDIKIVLATVWRVLAGDRNAY